MPLYSVDGTCRPQLVTAPCSVLTVVWLGGWCFQSYRRPSLVFTEVMHRKVLLQHASAQFPGPGPGLQAQTLYPPARVRGPMVLALRLVYDGFFFFFF